MHSINRTNLVLRESTSSLFNCQAKRRDKGTGDSKKNVYAIKHIDFIEKWNFLLTFLSAVKEEGWGVQGWRENKWIWNERQGEKSTRGTSAAGMRISERSVRVGNSGQDFYSKSTFSTFFMWWWARARSSLSKSTSQHKPSPGDAPAHVQCYVRLVEMLAGWFQWAVWEFDMRVPAGPQNSCCKDIPGSKFISCGRVTIH